MFQTKTEQFEGPLDLLLSLIEKEKLDITQISLAKITGSYLATIQEIEGDSSELADFLVIAAKLLYLKSKELIPSVETDEEESEIEDLEARLREYQAYKKAAEHLDGVLSDLNRSYSKRGKSQIPTVFTPPEGVDGAILMQIFQEVMNRTKGEQPEAAVYETERKVTLEERRDQITAHLKKKRNTSFRELLGTATSKVEVIVTFLAILEMIKQKEIVFEQKANFADLILTAGK